VPLLKPITTVLRDVGTCIYCGAPGTSTEHVIPIGLSGPQVLTRASCDACAKVTSRFERELLRGPLLPMRTVLELFTRDPKDRPTTFPATLVFEDGRRERRDVPAAAYPATLFLPPLMPPPFLTGESRPMQMVEPQWVRGFTDPEAVRAYVGSVGAKTLSFESNIRAQPLAQLVAKIAHGFAVGQLGLQALGEVLLPSVTAGADVEELGPYVGGRPELEPPVEDLHVVQVKVRADGLVGVTVRLLARYGAPTYMVVVSHGSTATPGTYRHGVMINGTGPIPIGYEMPDDAKYETKVVRGTHPG
jgi:hypothetical protein